MDAERLNLCRYVLKAFMELRKAISDVPIDRMSPPRGALGGAESCRFGLHASGSRTLLRNILKTVRNAMEILQREPNFHLFN